MAAKNGNLNVIQFLINADGDPHISSRVIENNKQLKVCDGIEETPLEVAIRWNHKDCVEWMISNISYSQQVLKKSLELAWSEEIKQLVKSKVI